MKSQAYAWLGFWRDKMPDEAVRQLQEILGPLHDSACRHDLLLPDTTVEVLSDYDARCTMCFMKWRTRPDHNPSEP